MTQQQTDPNSSDEAGGRFELSMQEIKVHGIRPSDIKWIVGAASFTITMLGLRFAAQAIADIINAINP